MDLFVPPQMNKTFVFANDYNPFSPGGIGYL